MLALENVRHNLLDLCREHLFSAEADIVAQFGEAAAERIMRVRDMYMWRLANPDGKDRQFVYEFKSRYPMGKNSAQEYLHLDHCFASPELVKSIIIHARWQWLSLSDYLPLETHTTATRCMMAGVTSTLTKTLASCRTSR